MNKNPFTRTFGEVDPGIACLWMIACFYDRRFEGNWLKHASSAGVKRSLADLSLLAEKTGFNARCATLSYRELRRSISAPCIVELTPKQYAILLPRRGIRQKKVRFVVPDGAGVRSCSEKEFIGRWSGEPREGLAAKGNVLVLGTTFEFRSRMNGRSPRLKWSILTEFFRQSRWQLFRVAMALSIGFAAQLIFPFLVQSIVDVGISTSDLQYITIILFGQLVLVLSRISADVLRGRLLLYISTRVNLSMLSNFWIKLTRLPLEFFDRMRAGDILQRINDNRQVQNFVTGPALNTSFSMLSFIVFAFVLAMYNLTILLIFGVGIALYLGWMQLFFRIRRKINYQIFSLSAKENDTTLQFIQGMPEIRLQNIGQNKRWEWEDIQVQLFKLNFKSLKYTQLQQGGALLLGQIKDILVIFFVARSVIEGRLTLGAMFAIQYIIGQMSSNLEQFIGFIQSVQDTKISMERLSDIHLMEDEEKKDRCYISRLPEHKSIFLDNLSFVYPDSPNKKVLSDISLEIPEGKTTAIIGESGSGKTTLLKLLLKYYEKYEGAIGIGDLDLKDLNSSWWRGCCGAILQDSCLFNDTIAGNITLRSDGYDRERLLEACRLSNSMSFIDTLPMGLDTRVGSGGIGLSQGQKQRILIARLIYKDPEFVLLDESTNSLDGINENAIVDSLSLLFQGRTVIVVAHRLNTVRNADNIVVLHQGVVVEQGSHDELSARDGQYCKLMKEQLMYG